MKNKKALIASLLVGVSALTLGTATACDGLPTWLGGKEPTYKVVISINGQLTEVDVTEGAIPQKPEDPVKEGYDFKGWYLDEACTKEYKFDKPLTGDSSLYAYFTEKEYTVTFVVDGVENKVNFTWSQIPTISTPKKDGFVFKTWCLDEACTEVYEFTAPVREPITVYAKFVEAYKVQYVVTPDLSTEEKETVETELNTAPIKPRDPEVEGYDFEGWFLDAEFTVPYNFDTVLEAGATVYAKLTEKSYEVTYMVGGTDVVLGEVVTYKYWTVPTKPQDPAYDGQHFFGWYLDEEYKNSYDFSYTLKKDTTVYAQFMEYKPIYTVEDLLAIAENPTANYALMNDLDFRTEDWIPIEEFSGKLDGNGYKITNFTMNITSAQQNHAYSASHGFVKSNKGTIKNLTLENFDYVSTGYGNLYVGTIAAVNYGTVENCTVNNAMSEEGNGIKWWNYNGTQTGWYYSSHGVLVGYNCAGGVVKNCVVNAEVSFYSQLVYTCRYNRVGGAVGLNDGTVENVSIDWTLMPAAGNGDIVASAEGNGAFAAHNYVLIGGAVGVNIGTITRVSVDMDTILAGVVWGSNYKIEFRVGGLTEENSGTITNCVVKANVEQISGVYFYCGGITRYNTATATITDTHCDVNLKNIVANEGYMGGFVGFNEGTIERCYAKGSMETKSKGAVGGFVGTIAIGSTIKTSFSEVSVSATSATMGVFFGSIQGSTTLKNNYYSTEATVLKNGVEYESDAINGIMGKTTEELYSRDLLLNKLYFDETVWVVDGENAPTLVWEKA